ncbi:MAG: hypothetical protein C4320_00795 [Armatimonadota bacterium]
MIAPTQHHWESGVTFNTAALLLIPGEDDVALEALLPHTWRNHSNGVVALHYRARPADDPGFRWTRSYVGLALFTPDLSTELKRWDEPVLSPGDKYEDSDFYGVEDPRITKIGSRYYLVYCGVQPKDTPDPEDAWIGTVCMAVSDDLLHWEKLGAIIGSSDAFAAKVGDLEPQVSNKDGVLFPGPIGGKYYLMHRPMRGPQASYTTDLAVADRPEGPYEDLGVMNSAMQSDEYVASWPGGGTVPIEIAPGRFVALGHTGNYMPGLKRKYVLDAFLFDFNKFDGRDPSTLIAARMDDIMRPETDCEVHGPYPDSVANVVFACGSYVYEGWLYILYGGGDTFILAARLRFDQLVEALESREK